MGCLTRPVGVRTIDGTFGSFDFSRFASNLCISRILRSSFGICFNFPCGRTEEVCGGCARTRGLPSCPSTAELTWDSTATGSPPGRPTTGRRAEVICETKMCSPDGEFRTSRSEQPDGCAAPSSVCLLPRQWRIKEEPSGLGCVSLQTVRLGPCFCSQQVTAVIELSLGSLQMPLSTLMMVPDLPQGLKLTQLLQISLEFLLKILIM